MRTRHLAAALALAALAAPRDAASWVVVRAPAYHPRPVVVVPPPPVYVPPPPVYVAPPPSVAPPPASVAPPPPAAPTPPPPPLTTRLPIHTRLGTLPSGCTQVWVGDDLYHVCGDNWLKGSDQGPYFVVVPAPQ